MGILRDMVDTVSDLKHIKDKAGLKTRKYSSISKRSTEGTLQFPVLVSKSMDIDTLQIISKALERQFASFIQVVLSMSPALDLNKEKDAIGFLRKFHQNSSVKTDTFDLMAHENSIHSAFEAFVNEESGLVLLGATYEGSTGPILASNKKQLESMLEHVREDILNRKYTPRATTYKFTNENLTVYHNTVVYEADGEKRDTSKVAGRDGRNVPDRLLRDNEVRKSNELVPTTLHIRTLLMNEQGQQGYMDFIIGVKTTMHPVSTDEMVNNLLGAVRNQGKFFNFVRWTSGETNFFKDFLFNIREIKDDVVDRSAGASPWWIALKRRRRLAAVKDRLLLPNQILPNASIVVSMEEVDAIKSQYGFDLMQVSVADKIMSKYFLLGLVVVDNSSQVAHFLFDGQTDYQSISFSGLEKENSSKTDLRDVMKIIDRSRMV